jgi:hypothetical protein
MGNNAQERSPPLRGVLADTGMLIQHFIGSDVLTGHDCLGKAGIMVYASISTPP